MLRSSYSDDTEARLCFNLTAHVHGRITDSVRRGCRARDGLRVVDKQKGIVTAASIARHFAVNFLWDSCKDLVRAMLNPARGTASGTVNKWMRFYGVYPHHSTNESLGSDFIAKKADSMRAHAATSGAHCYGIHRRHCQTFRVVSAPHRKRQTNAHRSRRLRPRRSPPGLACPKMIHRPIHPAAKPTYIGLRT